MAWGGRRVRSRHQWVGSVRGARQGGNRHPPARVGTLASDLYLCPEGDYLRLVRHEPTPADASDPCYGLPAGRYSVQICPGGDPLDIDCDDECDLCDRNFAIGGLTNQPARVNPCGERFPSVSGNSRV